MRFYFWLSILSLNNMLKFALFFAPGVKLQQSRIWVIVGITAQWNFVFATRVSLKGGPLTKVVQITKCYTIKQMKRDERKGNALSRVIHMEEWSISEAVLYSEHNMRGIISM